LIGFERRIGGVEAWIALHLEAADDIKNGDETHLPNAIDQHPALGIEFPFVVWLRICQRFGRR
jgi:hypothetical protein